MFRLLKESLTFQIVVATLLGLFVGLFFGEMTRSFAPWGSAYIMLLKVTAIPYVFLAIIYGIGQLEKGQAKMILRKGLSFVLLIWAINFFTIYAVYWLFPGTKGPSAYSYVEAGGHALNFSEMLIPENIFFALSNNIIPAIVIFALLLGIALIHNPERAPLMRWLEILVRTLTRITLWIARITPIGSFLIIAEQAGTIDLSTVQQIGSYLALFLCALLILTFWVIPRLVSLLTPIKATTWIKELFPVLVLAYTTNAVIVCLPYIVERLKKVCAHLFPQDEHAHAQQQGIIAIIFNLPLGSLFIAIFLLFVSVLYHMPMGLFSHLLLIFITLLAGLGSGGPGFVLNNLSFTLDTLSLPIDAINLFVATIPFTFGAQSMISVMEIATLGLLISLATRHLLKFSWHRALREGLFISLPLVLIFFSLKIWKPFPDITSTKPTICDVALHPTIPVKIYKEAPPPRSPYPNEDALDMILRTKTLRVGFNPNVPPFCFCNSAGALTGYDVSFAYALAHDLNVSLEFVPLHYDKVGEEVQKGVYDIGMSAISVTEERLRTICFASYFLDAKIIFVVRDKNKALYDMANALAHHPEMRIAAFKGSAFESFARKHFPNHEVVPLENYEEFAKDDLADVLIWTQPEAISWTLRHPQYRIVNPEPSLGMDSFAYAIHPASARLRCYVNEWLRLKKQEGFMQSQYDLWILGKTEQVFPPPRRWSIMHDVLHWDRHVHHFKGPSHGAMSAIETEKKKD